MSPRSMAQGEKSGRSEGDSRRCVRPSRGKGGGLKEEGMEKGRNMGLKGFHVKACFSKGQENEDKQRNPE